MLKGKSTLVEYDLCIQKGLCEEHLKEFSQNELAAMKNEFPKKAFKFVRVNVLYPFLSNKPPKYDKMKKLMENTPPLAKFLLDDTISEEAANVILIVDSVVIFTICQLSKICCIGAIFHTIKNSDDPIIKAMQNLLLVNRLSADIRYLYPILQKNFIGFDLDIIRATHCITLLFIRKFCHKKSLKIAIETIENDIKTNCDFDQVTVVCNEYKYKNRSCIIRKTSTASSALLKFYSPTDYIKASDYFYSAGRYELAIFFGYLAVSMENSVGESIYPFVKALLVQKLYKEAFDVATFAEKQCEKNTKQNKKLSKLLRSLSDRLASELAKSANQEISDNHNDVKDKISSDKKENSNLDLVQLVDSDSDESDSEVNKDAGLMLLAEAIDSDDNSEDMEKKEVKSEIQDEIKNESKNGFPECIKETSVSQEKKEVKSEIQDEIKDESKNGLPECIKETSVSQDVPKLSDAACSDEESENKKKKQVMNGTKEKNKNKSYSKRKRTISEGSVDNQPEEEIDINKINSYLKEASEAVLADCGYKAVQIFRGPLRKFSESGRILSLEECDVVCIKYSWAIAHCKSGGHDDLEKCINLLKEIIEVHDSITFPAVYYSLGIAFRKLNRFKEALNYLEIVQNFLQKGIHFKVYPWPGMTTVIQETKPDVLKNLVQNLIKECENPPNPDAFCRYENCSFQPTIYYTDPDFKGYVSLSCSEQCNLQYHLQCWKIIKEEKNLTDKEFLEKSCFTPDCEGFIAKIQNIDKKGDLGKEFVSEFKKPQKLPKKWEKKAEKEKKKKKAAVKSEGGSQEILTENGKNRSRKSSVCDLETTENKKDHSRESSVCDNETTSQFSGSCISSEEISSKIGCNQKLSENLKQKVEVPVSSSSNCVPSSLQENSYTNHIENFKELSTSVEENESEFELMECIKNNAYSYLADLLHYNGPLRVDDPILTSEIELFPVEIYDIVSKSGGIGEFLKNDLRFAFVGDLYVCVIDDVAKAYQMLNNASLPTDFKNLHALGSNEDSKYYHENDEKISDAEHSSFLNPNAQEYTPTNNKNNVYKFSSNNLPQDSDSHCSLPINLESSYKHPSSVSQLDTFSTTEISVSKSKSCEAVSDRKFQKDIESVLSSSFSKEKNPLVTNEYVDKSKLHPDPNSDFLTICDNKSANGSIDDSSGESTDLVYKKLKYQLFLNLNKYFSDEMMRYRESEISPLKPYIIKKIDELISEGTMTDNKFQLKESNSFENASTLDQDDLIQGLKKEIYDLSKKNSSLQNDLEYATEEQKNLSVEIARLRACYNTSTAKIEIMKKDFEKKEKDLLKEKVSLVQSLTDANKFVGTVQQKNATLAEEKLKLQKTIDNLTLSLKKEEEKMKLALFAQEKKFSIIIECLQKENIELKNRNKHAELQVLYMKKTEYLKRIEAKYLEVDEVKKEMSSPSMQLWANAAGPEQMNILSTKLNNYVEELKAIKQDFIEKIDQQIKMVKNGMPLKDLKEVVMKDLASVPTYKNTLPEHLLAGMSRFSSMTLPYFGTSTHLSSGTAVKPASSLISSATSALKITPPSTATTKIIPPISPALATKIISPVAPVAAPKIIPPVASIAATNTIPSITPSANIIPPSAPPVTSASLTSIPPVFKANKDNKIDLSNDIDITIQESFKNAMASINSFASTPYPVPSLDEEFDKNCVVFKHPEPISNDIKPDLAKVPPGLVNSVTHPSSDRTSAITPIPEPIVDGCNATGEKSYASLDTIPKIKVNQNTWEYDKKKTTASYSKLLTRLKEQFPTYSQEDLMSYIKEVRTQRQGKLSGLTIDAIISEISAIMKAKKKMPELKVQPKPAKILVNKKLVPDPPKPPAEPQTTKKKTAWNIDTDAAKRRFSGSADDDCTICCDPMANSAYKVACGHFFHEDCIRQWLKKNSNCPICRILLLLPEEYPSLS